MKLSVVIPAYNEADRITVTLTAARAYLAQQSYRSEILVVSDGSRDATRRVVEDLSALPGPALRCLEYHPNRGKGHAVRYGMLRAGGDVVMFMDADYAVPMAAVADGLALLAAGNDIAIGSRTLAGAQVRRHQSRLREAAGRFYTLVQNRVLGLGYGDTQCGFKLFAGHTVRPLFGRQRLDSVIFDPEILFLARRLGFAVAEFPVRWRHHPDSRIQYDRVGKMLFVFRELFRIRGMHRGDIPNDEIRSTPE